MEELTFETMGLDFSTNKDISLDDLTYSEEELKKAIPSEEWMDLADTKERFASRLFRNQGECKQK